MIRVRFLLVGLVSLENACRSIFLGYHLTGRFGVMEHPVCNKYYARFWIFWREFFGARKRGLASRGSKLGLAGLQNSLPHNGKMRCLFGIAHQF